MKIKIKYEKVEPNIEILMLSFKFTKIREVSIYWKHETLMIGIKNV